VGECDEQKEAAVLVQESQDAWSLGVMAFELLTGQPALRMREGKEYVWP
jgi:hypothetical protein